MQYNYSMHRDKKVLLRIDTSDRTKSVVVLEDAGGIKRLEVETPLGSGSAVLTAIEKLLTDAGHNVKDVTDVRVATGPGSYTGLRVGIAIANMLGTLLGVPINDLAVGQTVTPQYEGDRYSS